MALFVLCLVFIALTISTISKGGGENQRIMLHEKTFLTSTLLLKKWFPRAFTEKKS